MYIVIERESKEIIGRVSANHSMTFDEIMEYSGFEWIEGSNETGWSDDGGVTFYDETVATAFSIPDDIRDNEEKIVEYFTTNIE